MRGLEAVHGVGGSKFAGLDDEGEERRDEAEEEEGRSETRVRG